jgi:hypothetical protein
MQQNIKRLLDVPKPGFLISGKKVLSISGHATKYKAAVGCPKTRVSYFREKGFVNFGTRP